MSLKELTKDLHKTAEQSKFSHLLLNGRVTKEQYRKFLYQLIAVYGPIEFSSRVQGFFSVLADDPRLPQIYKDWDALREPGSEDYFLPETLEYSNYLINLGNDPDRKHLIKAHGYVRYLGDLSGGQFLMKSVPGEHHMFKFKRDVNELKAALMKDLTDDLADEARVAFKYAISIMEAMLK